jgi:hypothetical protein
VNSIHLGWSSFSKTSLLRIIGPAIRRGGSSRPIAGVGVVARNGSVTASIQVLAHEPHYYLTAAAFLSGRRNDHRHPGHTRAAALGCGRRARADVPDLEAGAKLCRFTDCGHHDGTPGCGVQAPIESGTLSPERVASWSKLTLARGFLDRKKDKCAQSEQEKKTRAMTLARGTHQSRQARGF